MDFLSELKLRNISINECAKKTGIAYGALYPIVHKKIELENCQYVTLKKLANFFLCSVEDLFDDFSDFTVFWKDEKVADIKIVNNDVEIIRYTLNPAKQIFFSDKISKYELGDILKWRCWDSNRENIEKYLYSLGVTDFNPYRICRKTHGVMVQDKIWFKFKNENLCWNDVKCS